jgi:tetratricopeptide (TPR) repeat protein
MVSTLAPHEINSHLLKANYHRQAREYERAIEIYRLLIESDTDNADYYFLLGKAFAESGNTQQAVESYRTAHALGNRSAKKQLVNLGLPQSMKD